MDCQRDPRVAYFGVWLFITNLLTINLYLFNSVVLNVSAMSQGDVFVYLLSSKEPTTVEALGIFLHNAFMKREKVMNHYQS